jgi:phage tail P2-like protein
MFKTIDIVPSSIANDPQVQSACHAIDKELEEIYGCIPSILFWPFINEQVPPLLDVLAWEMHVDVWAGWEGELSVEMKRQLINESIEWHRYKGTKWAVQHMLDTVFQGGKVTEWYEYGGDPYFFRVITQEDVVDPQAMLNVIKAIYAVKNARSWMDGFYRNRLYGQTLWIGFYTRHKTTIHIGYPGWKKEYFSNYSR